MVELETLKREILERLRPLDPERVILFGSYAYGTPTEESGIDLYVVTKDDFVPGSFREKAELRLKVSELLLDLRLRYPIDLIVHTRPMHEEFKKEFKKWRAPSPRRSFNGELYSGEKDYPRLAAFR